MGPIKCHWLVVLPLKLHYLFFWAVASVFQCYCMPLYVVPVYTLSHPSTLLYFLSWPNSEGMDEPKLSGFLLCIDVDSSGSYFHLI